MNFSLTQVSAPSLPTLPTAPVLSTQPDPDTEPGDWTVEETIGSLTCLAPSLASHVETFRNHEIDGERSIANPN